MKNNIILEYKRSDKKFNNLDVIDSAFFHAFIKDFFMEYNVCKNSETTIELFNESKRRHIKY